MYRYIHLSKRTFEGLGGTPSRAPPPRRYLRVERLPVDRHHRGALGSPSTAYPDCHVDPLQLVHQVQELTRWTTPVTARRHARPGRRLQTRRRCPRAVTGMAIPMLCSSNLLPRGRRRVRREQNLAQLPPRRKRSCTSNGSIALPRKSSGASTGSSPMNSNRCSSTSPPCPPPDGRTRALAPCRTSGSPAGPPWRTGCSS